MLIKLSPNNESQRWRLAKALELSGEFAEERWLLVERAQSSLPTPFLVVLVIWMMILFVSFSLFAPSNKTVLTILLLCALSVSGQFFSSWNLTNRPAAF